MVHLANHYVESYYTSRHKKIQDAFGEMGISILGGAITTIGSGLVLFGAELLILKKFALLITSTILFSLIFSLLFFGAVLHLLGPEGRVGSLRYLFCCSCVRRKKRRPRSLSFQKIRSLSSIILVSGPSSPVKRDSIISMSGVNVFPNPSGFV